jgi:ribosomal protein S27E
MTKPLSEKQINDDVDRRYEQMMAHCPDCKKDKMIFCPRNCDAQCLICGKSFCGGHIGLHLHSEHCVNLGFNHCRRITPSRPTRDTAED